MLCELCGSTPAKVYCDSDRASLCWDCDAKVHGANVLVAKHGRAMLCHLCQSPTPWKASGFKLPPSMSLCIYCSSPALSRLPVLSSTHLQQPVDRDDHQLSASTCDIDDHEDDSEEEQGYMSYSDDDEENQVVPCTPNARSISEPEEEEEDNDQISVILPAALTSKRKWDMAFSTLSDHVLDL